MKKGFTLIELLVTISIFTLMTGYLVAKYRNFDSGTILTNLAYDVALNIRNAQSYGLNVRQNNNDSSTFSGVFDVTFKANSTSFTLNGNGSEIAKTNIKRGSKISAICTGDGNTSGNGNGNGNNPCANSRDDLTIAFVRPDPSAIFKIDGSTISDTYAQITVMAADGRTRYIIVRSNGQIYVPK